MQADVPCHRRSTHCTTNASKAWLVFTRLRTDHTRAPTAKGLPSQMGRAEKGERGFDEGGVERATPGQVSPCVLMLEFSSSPCATVAVKTHRI